MEGKQQHGVWGERRLHKCNVINSLLVQSCLNIISFQISIAGKEKCRVHIRTGFWTGSEMPSFGS